MRRQVVAKRAGALSLRHAVDGTDVLDVVDGLALKEARVVVALIVLHALLVHGELSLITNGG